MELNEKIQELRRRKGLTQEELAQALFVSRAAISRWESGRGYPNIDSLKALAKFSGVTIDELLSGEELLTIAQEDSRKREERVQDLVFGLLDCSAALFFLLPFFGQRTEGAVQAVALFALTQIAPYLKWAYVVVIAGLVALGALTLALQNAQAAVWQKHKRRLSLGCNGVGVLLFIISSQPYAAALLFVFLVMKALILGKRP